MLVTVLLDCDSTPSSVPADPSYAADVQTIFGASCITCHGTSSPSGSYSLTSYAGATGPGSDTVPNVAAGSANSSQLYRRLLGNETPQMPLGQPALDTVKTTTVRNWIDNGANSGDRICRDSLVLSETGVAEPGAAPGRRFWHYANPARSRSGRRANNLPRLCSVAPVSRPPTRTCSTYSRATSASVSTCSASSRRTHET